MKYLRIKGNILKGKSFGANKNVSGEVVFTTGMIGYNETLTDPSYKNQILVFTNPLIGNYGVPSRIKEHKLYKYFESSKIHLSGIIVNNYSEKYSHWNAVESLSDTCKHQGIPLLSDIDTRNIVNIIREYGSTRGEIIINDPNEFGYYDNKIEIDQIHPIKTVSVEKSIVFNKKGSIKICLIDCGTKYNIIRHLINRNCQVTLVPHDFDVSKLIKEFDGIMVGNGPGDPSKLTILVDNIKKIINNEEIIKPMFNICAGHQLLGVSVGFDIFKMKHGHRSHNAPVIDTFTNRCFITSQNHGYCLSNTFIPNDWIITYINANDITIEGIKHKFKPYSSVQFHPEANSGPKDFEFLFDDFVNECILYKK